MFPANNGKEKKVFEESEYNDLADEMKNFLTGFGIAEIRHEIMRGNDF